MDSTTSTATSPSSTSSDTSSRLVTALRKLAVDLKMDLAEALAKVDNLTLANQRLARERDEARAEIRRLRRSQYMYQHHIRSHSDRDVQRRRASDGGAPSLRTMNEGRLPSLRNILSGLHDEVMPFDHALGDDDIHILSSPPPSPTLAYLIADQTSSDASDGQQDTDISSKSFNELQRRYKDISLEGDNKNLGLNVAETDKAAGLPQIRHKISKLSTASTTNQHQGDFITPPKEEEEEEEDEEDEKKVSNETYHEYTTKTNFSGTSSTSTRNPKRGRSTRRLVSELQIAQARITFGDESR